MRYKVFFFLMIEMSMSCRRRDIEGGEAVNISAANIVFMGQVIVVLYATRNTRLFGFLRKLQR